MCSSLHLYLLASLEHHQNVMLWLRYITINLKSQYISLWGWRSPGTGCPGRLWSLLLWRYSRPAWTRSCTACSGWPCFGRGVGLGDPQRALPTLTSLRFCDCILALCWVNTYLKLVHPFSVHLFSSGRVRNHATALCEISFFKGMHSALSLESKQYIPHIL